MDLTLFPVMEKEESDYREIPNTRYLTVPKEINRPGLISHIRYQTRKNIRLSNCLCMDNRSFKEVRNEAIKMGYKTKKEIADYVNWVKFNNELNELMIKFQEALIKAEYPNGLGPINFD
tara:strand:- start:1218 stop:1574 length:357 start_codon:yes stop_codon:yes gene_type:complete